MSKRISYSPDDDNEDLVHRYEKYLTNEGSGYFDVDELEKIIDYYLHRGQTKDSNAVVDLGFKLHPGSLQLQIKRAKIYLAAGDAQKALRQLDKFGNNEDYDTYLIRIESLVRLNRINEAKLLCDGILNGENEETDLICLDFSMIFMSSLEMETALIYLKKGVKSNPANTDLQFDMAFCYESLFDITKAIETYNSILKVNPYSSEAWFNLGQIYFNQQDFNKALTAFDYAHAINPDDPLTCLQKAHSHFQQQEYQDAIHYYTEYSNQSDDKWQSNLYIAECYERQELFSEALEYYHKSLDSNKDNYDALTGITVCLLELEKYSESIEYAQKALELNENASDAWVYLAEGFTGIENTDAAFLAYLKSVSIDRNQPDTLMAIGNIAMEKGEFDMALRYYQEAKDLGMDAELENIELFMAVAYYKTGQNDKAQESLDEAIARNLDSESLFYELCPNAHF